MRHFVCVSLLTCCSAAALAQQVSDDAFRFSNGDRAFAVGEGPRVCIDEGHYNFHTAEGRYKPFANLVRDDGYRVVRFSERFSESTLERCDLMVIANALAAQNETDWRYPHHSAFDGDELRAMKTWIREGGSLLLFADHAPNAAAARELGAVLGVVMTDVYAANDRNPGPDRFRLEDGTLHPHPIQAGRSTEESVAAVTTFTGQPAQITEGWVPLLTFGSEAVAFINPQQIFEDDPDGCAFVLDQRMDSRRRAAARPGTNRVSRRSGDVLRAARRAEPHADGDELARGGAESSVLPERGQMADRSAELTAADAPARALTRSAGASPNRAADRCALAASGGHPPEPAQLRSSVRTE